METPSVLLALVATRLNILALRSEYFRKIYQHQTIVLPGYQKRDVDLVK